MVPTRSKSADGKRWGIIFKCLTTRCVHLDLLCSMDADSFLLTIKSSLLLTVKASLQVVLKDHTISKEVLSTVLIELEGILNSKPLGYVSSDIADPDPITPICCLWGSGTLPYLRLSMDPVICLDGIATDTAK